MASESRLLLRNHDRFDNWRLMDPLSGKLMPVAAPAGEHPPSAGWWVRRAGGVMALYVHAEQLTFRHRQRTWNVEATRVTRHRCGPLFALRLTPLGARTCTVAYLDFPLAHRWFIPSWLDSTWTDPEDFDWSRFLVGVLADDQRCERIRTRAGAD